MTFSFEAQDMRYLFSIFLSLALFAPSPYSAQAAPDPKLQELLNLGAEALLKEADERHFRFDTQLISVRMTMFGGADKGRQIEMTTRMKGENKRAIEFHKPADLKGMRVVIKGRNDIKVRIPDMNKVRKVASHARRQTFYGTDWSFDDMTMLRLAKDFAPKIVDQNDTHVVLELLRKEGVDLSYAKLRVLIDKTEIMIPEIQYFDDDGKMVREQVRTDLKTMPNGHKLYHRVEMRNKTRDHKTVVDVLKEEVNIDLPDSTFSRRWLVRGP